MSGDSNNVKIDITASAAGMEPGISQAQQKFDALGKVTSKVASEYTGLNASVRQNGVEVQNTDKNVRQLLDRYDPLGAKLRQLQGDFNRLSAAAAGGKISGADDTRVDQVYARMQKEIMAVSAATDVHTVSTNRLALSSKQLAQANRQLPMQFTDIWVSLAAGQSPMMVMLQQGTQIKDSFGGVGASAKAMGGYIMGLINPITLAAAAAAAAGAAWYAWGRDAETAADKAVAASEKIIAGMRSTDSVYVLMRERDKIGKQIPVAWLSYDEKSLARLDDDSQKLIKEYRKIDKALKGEVARSGREWDGLHATDAERKTAALKQERQLYDEQVVLAKGNSDKLIALEQQHQQKIAAINKSFESKKTGRGDDRTESEKAFADAWVETQRVLQNTDPQAKANAEWEKMLYLQSTLGEQFPLTTEQMGAAYAKSMAGIVKATDKAAAGMSEIWKTYRDSTQRVLGDQFFDAMMGKFSSLEDGVKQMIFRISANAAAANFTEKLFGKDGTSGGGWLGSIGNALFGAKPNANGNAFGGSGIVPFANGGAFGDGMVLNGPTPFLFKNGGSFNMGVAGEAGAEGALPLKRMSNGKLGVYADGSGGGGGSQITITDNSVIHVDSRSDRAQVLQDVARLTDNKLAQWTDNLRRQGVIA